MQGYYSYLIHKVKLIRIETEDVAKALMIFETINDRGVSLDAMDLLKNLLFRNADEQDFDRLKDRWQRLKNIIYDMKEKPIRFLRYFILSDYDINSLRQDEIYKKILETKEIVRDCEKQPMEFTEKLIEAAEAYQNFTISCDARKNYVPYLDNIMGFAGRAARQHFILLLAGRHLPTKLFSALVKEVENVFFAHVITHKQANALEKLFSECANDIRKRKVSRKGHIDDFLKDKLIPAKTELANRFVIAFEQASEKEIKRKGVLRYVLYKLVQFVEMNAYQVKDEKPDVYKKYQIEHIHPQKPSVKASKEFGECSDETINMLGNLTLLENPLNGHLKNKPFSEKRDVYRDSTTLLTRTIVQKVRVGNSSITRAVKGFEPYDEWNEINVKHRQRILTNLAKRVWDVEDSS